MKYPPRRHRHRAHVSRAQPYTTTQYRIAQRLRRPNVWSRHRQCRQFAGPPQWTHLRQRTVARLDPQSPAYQAAGDESPGYQDERGNYGEGFVGDYGNEFVGDYGDGFVGDYGEENACQNHPELEQRMNQVIEIARAQSEQIHDIDKTTRELVQQMREVVQQVSTMREEARELPNNLVENISLSLCQTAETLLQGEQDQVRQSVTGEHATMDPVEMSTKGSELRC